MSSKSTDCVDERFSKVKKDPRFWEMPNKERKIKIDKRFRSMFHDKRFKLKYTVDKRGRPVHQTSSEDLKRFYQLSDSEQSDEDEDSENNKTKDKKKTDSEEEAHEKEDADASDESEENEQQESNDVEKSSRGVKVYKKEDEESGVEEDEDASGDGTEEEESEAEEDSDSGPDLARGKGNIETSSEEEDNDDDDELEEYLRKEEEEIEHDWGEMSKDALRSEDTSRRLAVCNMDWDRLKAKDLLALFNSFKPKGGVVMSVAIYPSEFGKERMKAEQTQGPPELTSLPEDPEKDTEEQRICRERIRDYQFKRLRYYYGVVECDSAETALKIYSECDGFEYESSSSTIDLRFIPDDVTFDDEPKDRATDVDYGSYKPNLFQSRSNTTAKVEITWDETDHDRVSTLCRKFNKDELLNMDFNAYLASSSEEEEDEEVDDVKQDEITPEEKSQGKKNTEQIAKYREILKNIQEKEKKDDSMDMEITWVPGLKESTEKLVKKKMEAKDKLSPWEEFLEKKREKKKEKRKGQKEANEAEPVISDDDLPADVDLHDPFFAEELGSTASQNKKQKKKKKKEEEERTPEEEEEMEKKRAEMELLMDDDEDDQHKHFNYDKIVEHQNLSKKKRKKLLKKKTPLEDDDNFQVDVHDPRFQVMFTSHLYNLDPSNPAYKKTKATQSILEEKQRRRDEEEQLRLKGALESQAEQEEASAAGTSSGKAADPSLMMLIKSVKNKTQQFQARKKLKTK